MQCGAEKAYANDATSRLELAESSSWDAGRLLLEAFCSNCVVCCGAGGRAISVKNCIAAIDQGTTSTRFMVFDQSARIAAVAQEEHRQIFPTPGWVEHDPLEILCRTKDAIAEAERAKLYQQWKKAVTRSFDWIEP